jgi:hypothetical protein
MITRQSLILLFALAFALFILGPAVLGQPFPGYPLMSWGDLLDIATPLALMPLYWVLFTDAGRVHRTLALALAFAVLAALWAEGHGIHLSANSIDNLLGRGSAGASAPEVHTLVHFYDEVLAHYLWHLGIISMSILLLAAPVGVGEVASAPRWGIITVSAVAYGFTYFAAVEEGGTVPLGLPAAFLIVVWLLFRKRAAIRTQNLVAFFFLAYAFALLLFVAWFARWGGFPQFSDLGLI